jgi:tetratricopeptide (TPR) repeat protein
MIQLVYLALSKSTNQAIAKVSPILEKLPTVMTDVDYFKHGNNCLELGENGLAVELFTKAIKINPIPEYYIGRAKARIQLLDKFGALDDYAEAIKLNPIEKDLFLVRGLLHCEMRNYDFAIQDWNKAAELKSETALDLFLEFDGEDSLRDFLHLSKINTAPHKFGLN